MPIKNLTLGLCLLMAGSVLAQETGYRVRNGECDWTIAKRHGISVKQLHSMNPGIDWDALRVGSKIQVPTSEHVSARQARRSSSKTKVAASTYSVRNGDNDWTIAHRAGVRLGLLKQLNPRVDLTKLRVGQRIRVPSSIASQAVAARRIRSTYAKVGGDNVTIRRGPGRGSESICTVDRGIVAAILDRSGSWYQLRFPKGTVGWVRSDLLEAAATPRRHRVRHDYVASRRPSHGRRSRRHNPGLNYVVDTSGEASGILEKANSLRGVRYHWGEASRSGTDCSGFTSQVFKSQGIKLPRTSHEQASVGQKVNYSDMKPGDLVFFHTTRGRRVSHVGIYVGKGKFIHASSSGGHVQVNSLDEGYYSHRLVTARRVGGQKSHKPAPKKTPPPSDQSISDPSPSDDGGN